MTDGFKCGHDNCISWIWPRIYLSTRASTVARVRALSGEDWTGLQSQEAARAALLSQDYILLQGVEERVSLQQHRNYDDLSVVSTSLAFVRNHMSIIIHFLSYSGLAWTLTCILCALSETVAVSLLLRENEQFIVLRGCMERRRREAWNNAWLRISPIACYFEAGPEKKLKGMCFLWCSFSAGSNTVIIYTQPDDRNNRLHLHPNLWSYCFIAHGTAIPARFVVCAVRSAYSTVV